MIGLSRGTTFSVVLAAIATIAAGVSRNADARTANPLALARFAGGNFVGPSVFSVHTARIAPPANLAASSATSSAVVLTWTGDAGAKVAIERKILGSAWLVPTAAAPATAEKPTPSTIAVIGEATLTDSRFDAFTTYVYRVRAVGPNNVLSAPSNELTVGPPPVGFSTVIATPKAMQAHDPAQFANQFRMTFDANGDPAIAYMTNDLNNDGELDDTNLSVITWNRAKYHWNTPVVLDTIGNVSRSGTRRPFAFTRDAATGTFGLLHMIGEHELRFSTSADGGMTWKHSRVDRNTNEDATISTPALTMASGRVYLAYAVGPSVTYKSGNLADPASNWTNTKIPLLPETEGRSECVNVVLDAAGKPLVSYCMSGEGYNTIVAVWRPDGGKIVKVMDTNHKQNDDPGLDMMVSGSQIGVAMYGARDEHFFANHHLWFAKSTDGGATWSAPVVVEDDGGNAMDAPVTMMMDRAGHPAMVANVGGGNDGAAKCGMPKLMRSTDGAKWTTCAPETKGAPSTADVVSPVGAFAGNDKIYIAFKARQTAPGMPAGLTLWRER